MKLYKSLLLGLLMCGFSACDTTDLERDINSLKDRVEDYEAQVQKLNDDMNIIRVLLDGNKTITSYSFDGTNYTLTLSNGETLTLTQGVVGANYPSITIGENGNWIIEGEDTGEYAVAKDGENAENPQFKIEGGTWWVYDSATKEWKDLKVSAVGSTSSTASSPIASVETSTSGVIKITLTAGGIYEIPVIPDLMCKITSPALADGEMWLVGTEGAVLEAEVTLASDDDIVRPIVPADWKAEITERKDGKLKVKVTPPVYYASKCVVTMEVTHGIHTITDEIVARTVTTGYYADFMAGLDIQVGSVTLNKSMFAEGEIHGPDENISALSAKGIYFLKSGTTVNLSSNLSVSGLVVIGNTPDVSWEDMPVIMYTGKCNISLNNVDGGKGLLLKNVEVDASLNTTYSFNIGSAFADNVCFENLVFDRCNLLFPDAEATSWTYINNNPQKTPIENIEVCNTLFSSKSGGQQYLFSLSNNMYKGFKNFTVENSVFYCRTENAVITNFSLLQCANADGSGFENIKVKNNTFVNVVPANQLVKVKMFNVDFSNNLLWRDNDKGGYLLYGVKGSVFGTTSFTNNMYYNADAGTVSFNLFNTDGIVPENVTNSLQKLSSDPFEILDVVNAKFVLLPEYQNVGAHIE